MIETKRTTLNIPKDMLKAIKLIAIEKETTQTKIILDFIAKGLEACANKDKKLNSKDMIGIVEVDNAENIDAQELKDSIHFKKELY